jgi:hypothetical protein
LNDYLTIHVQLETIPDITDVLKIIDLYDKHEIANIASFDGARNHVLETFQDEIDSTGRFLMGFDPTPAFKKFMNRIFQALYYKAADEKWKKADGEGMAVGLSVQQTPTVDMEKHGIDSPFILLRVIFSDECVAELLPLFKKRFAETYKEFLRDVQEAGIKGLMSFGYYNEMPTEL